MLPLFVEHTRTLTVALKAFNFFLPGSCRLALVRQLQRDERTAARTMVLCVVQDRPGQVHRGLLVGGGRLRHVGIGLQRRR